MSCQKQTLPQARDWKTPADAQSLIQESSDQLRRSEIFIAGDAKNVGQLRRSGI
jgi:hypothetical protein